MRCGSRKSKSRDAVTGHCGGAGRCRRRQMPWLRSPALQTQPAGRDQVLQIAAQGAALHAQRVRQCADSARIDLRMAQDRVLVHVEPRRASARSWRLFIRRVGLRRRWQLQPKAEALCATTLGAAVECIYIAYRFQMRLMDAVSRAPGAAGEGLHTRGEPTPTGSASSCAIDPRSPPSPMLQMSGWRQRRDSPPRRVSNKRSTPADSNGRSGESMANHARLETVGSPRPAARPAHLLRARRLRPIAIPVCACITQAPATAVRFDTVQSASWSVRSLPSRLSLSKARAAHAARARD